MTEPGSGSNPQGDGGTGGDPAPPEPPQQQPDSFRPITSQEDLDKILNGKLAQVRRQYGDKTPAEIRAELDRLAKIDSDLESEAERRERVAREQAEQAERERTGPRLVAAEFRAAGRGVDMDKEALDALIEDVRDGLWKRYLDDDGEPDVGKIEERVKKLTPKAGESRRQLPDLGGGQRGGTATSKNMNDLIREAAGVKR
jgi:hypothetical protein